MLAPLLFNIFFAAVINVALTYFEADKDIMDALVSLRKKPGASRRTARDPAPATSLWGMLYADDAAVVSQLPEQLRKMMVVIVTVCEAFGLTASEAKTEIRCLRTTGIPDAATTFSVGAAVQVYKQAHDFVYLGGNINHDADLSIEVDWRIRNAWCSFRKYSLELHDRPSPLELKIRLLKAEVLESMLYGCITWSPRLCHYDALRRSHHSFLTRCIGWRKHKHTDRPNSYVEALLKRGARALRRHCVRDGSCSRGLWRIWKTKDYRSA